MHFVFVFTYFFCLQSESGDKRAMNLLTQLRKSDDNIKRIDVGKVSCDQFLEQFEKLKKPVVITNSQVCHF